MTTEKEGKKERERRREGREYARTNVFLIESSNLVVYVLEVDSKLCINICLVVDIMGRKMGED